jgi:hypothetical protein
LEERNSKGSKVTGQAKKQGKRISDFFGKDEMSDDT